MSSNDRLKVLLSRPSPGLAVALFAIYLLFDLREGGRTSNLSTVRLSTPGFYIAHFGSWFFWGAVLLDLLLAAGTAWLLGLALSRYRARRTVGVCTTTGVVLLGFALFGCPGCMIPLFGTLGVAAFANALPLFGLEFKLVSIAVTFGVLAWELRSVPRQGAVQHAASAG